MTSDTPQGTGTTVYAYDGLGRRVSAETEGEGQHRIQRWERGADTVVVRTWVEADGGLIEAPPITEEYQDGLIVARGPEAWTWDRAGRLASYERPDEDGRSGWRFHWDDWDHVTFMHSRSDDQWDSWQRTRWSWDEERLLGWTTGSSESSKGRLDWTTHDERGLPLAGDGTRFWSDETPTVSWSEEWSWDEAGRALSHSYADDGGTAYQEAWTWGDHELITPDGTRYVWDDAGRLLVLEQDRTRVEWDWSADGALVEQRYSSEPIHRVDRWSPGCASDTWFEPEVPDPGPWPVFPAWLPGPLDARP